MKTVLVTVGDKQYRCKVAETAEEQKKGLSGQETLAPDEGMLFDYSKSDKIPEMWMKDTKIPLDILGIDKEGYVTQKETPEPDCESLYPFPNIEYILEVKANSGIQVGDDFEIDDDTDLDKYVMKILAPDGTAQGMLQGGERIFSRISTRKLIRNAKIAYKNRNDKELYERCCKKLGKIVFKELYAQDHRDPQYVEVPDKKHKDDDKSESDV